MNGKEAIAIVCPCGRIKCYQDWTFITTSFSVFMRTILSKNTMEDMVAIEILKGECPDCGGKYAIRSKMSKMQTVG